VPLTPIEAVPANEDRPPADDTVFEIEMFTVDAEPFEFPAASLKDPAAIVTTPVPPEVRDAVNVTE
jgi:hypothetical protein